MDSDYLGLTGSGLALEEAMRAHERERVTGIRVRDGDDDRRMGVSDRTSAASERDAYGRRHGGEKGDERIH